MAELVETQETEPPHPLFVAVKKAKTS